VNILLNPPANRKVIRLKSLFSSSGVSFGAAGRFVECNRG
jgi:hypothetical protein